MSFDLSRIRFDHRRDFLGVIMQQGRVQLDSDWNEWVAQLARRIQAGTLDTVGQAVVPRETADGFLIAADGGGLTIGPGRIYVDGLLAENHGAAPEVWNRHLAEETGTAAVDYAAQPYLPEPPALPAGAGPHLVYLDVWQRAVTHLQAPDLVEQAVGVDSTGRLQTVWQVKVLPDVGAITRDTPPEDIPGWNEATAPSAGRLSTGTGEPTEDPDPCHVPPSAGYRGLENQLYRVEIHRPGAPGEASFKWSRDNATVATRVSQINPARNKLTVESVGRDDVLRFHNGDWVEITDDWRELHGEPGELRRIKVDQGVDDTSRTIDLETPLPVGAFPVDGQGQTDPLRHTRIRRWDQSGQVRREDGTSYVDLDATGSDGEITVPPAGTRLFLEHGILVDFTLDPAGGEFHAGDSWVFAARSVDASVEILDQAPPRSIHHHYARLALVTFPDLEDDWRVLWPPRCEGEGESCDCTVCVTADAHNQGTATIQQALDEVRATGGTVCLGAGTYRIREPLRIAGAQSLRVRGQGWRTVILGEAPGTVLSITGSLGVALENLSILGSATGSRRTGMVTATNTFDLRLEHVNVVGVSPGDATSTAIELSGLVLGGVIDDCVLVAEQGVTSGGGKEDRLLTAHLAARRNLVFCSQRGFGFVDMSVHYGATVLADNLVLGCRHAGVIATGGVLPGSSFTVRDNVLYVEGVGVRAGVDGLRIQDNEISGYGERSADGIELGRGLDPVALDQVRIVGNRLRALDGHGIAIRHRVETGMIKQNTVTETGLGGLVIEGEGSAGYLTIENNHFLDLGRDFDTQNMGFAGLQLVAVTRADVLNNVFAGVARRATSAPDVAGILAGGVGELRVAGNRLYGVGPARSAGSVAGVRVLIPLQHLAVDDNSIARADGDEQLQPAAWQALRIDTGRRGEERRVAESSGSFAVVGLAARAVVFTAGRLHAIAVALPAVSVRGNRLRALQTNRSLVQIDGVETCLFAENHGQVLGDGDVQTAAIALLRANVVNASNNRLVGSREQDTMHVFNLGKRGIVIGNVSTGRIMIDGTDLPNTPWHGLNIIGT